MINNNGVRKVAFIAHCLANQNAKVVEFARKPGAIVPVVDQLRNHGYEIEQLPCPEMAFLGVSRWWQAKEQYDTTGYRRHCSDLSSWVVEKFKYYYQEGYEIIIVGLDGSPSSGIRFTASEPKWGGRPYSQETDGSVVPGMGIWMEELKRKLESDGLRFPDATGVLLDSPDWDIEMSNKELGEFLDARDGNGSGASK